MDGDPVRAPSPFKDIGEDDGGEKSPAVSVGTYTELFRKVWPEYLAIGMSYDEFWRMDASLARDYRKAYEIRQRREEWARWRQGAYIYDALLRVAPVLRAFGKGKVEAGEYPDEPYPLTNREAEERMEARRRQKMERMLEVFKRESAENVRKREMKGDLDGGGGSKG